MTKQKQKTKKLFETDINLVRDYSSLVELNTTKSLLNLDELIEECDTCSELRSVSIKIGNFLNILLFPTLREYFNTGISSENKEYLNFLKDLVYQVLCLQITNSYFIMKIFEYGYINKKLEIEKSLALTPSSIT